MTDAGGAERLRILLVTRNFPPQVGGMERFNERILAQLAAHFEVALCGPAGAAAFAPAGVPVRTCTIRSLPLFVAQCAWQARRLARCFKPDLVIAGSGLTAPMARFAANAARAPLAAFVYGLDLVVDSAVYQHAWMPFVRRCEGIIAISQFTRAVAIERGIHAERIRIVTPGVDAARAEPGAAAQFRREQGLGARPLLLAVGRLARRKGLVEFIEHGLPQVVARHPDVMLVCIGGDPVTSLSGNRGGLAAAAQASAMRLGLSGNLRMLGSVPDGVLAAAYQASQVHVFPVLDLPGDAEGFGIVALEAAANGLPTVAFAVGGVPDAIAAGRSGTLISSGNYAEMARAILQILDTPAEQEVRRTACLEHAREFAWDRIGARLREVVVEFARARLRRKHKDGRRRTTLFED